MHLIAALSAGIRGCENGSVRLFRRGTATRASWYSTFEASAAADSSGADIQLDANGGVVAYVNELVEVDCYSSLGVLVRSFVAGDGAPAVEAISPSFTGVDYVTGVSAVSKPLALSTILDRWLESAGTNAIDWKVLLNGAATTLQIAIGALNGLVFNVKSPAYGAVGDGTTDDTAAISAALAAAVAAGGGTVYFPLGTYRITSAIVWNHSVNIVGPGEDLAIVTTDTAASQIFRWTSGSAKTIPQLIYGLRFQSSQANTAIQLEATVAVNWLIVGCRFGGTTTSTGNLISYTGASRVVIRNCRLTVNTSGTAIAASATGTVLARDTIFDCGTTTYNGAFASTSGHADFEGCTFDNTTITAAGTFYAIQMANVNDVLLVHRCKFIQQTQTFTNGIRLVAGAKARIRDIVVPANSGTAFYNSVTLGNGSYIAPVSAAATGEAEYVSQSIGVAATIPFCEFWAANATSTVPSITLPNGFYPGQLLKITIYNNSGVGWAGNVNFTNGTTFGAVTTNAGIAGLVVGEFEYSDVGLLGTYSWTARSLKLGSAN